MSNDDLKLDYKVKVLPRGDEHVGDYVAYYFSVCESLNCEESFEFALTVSESAKAPWGEKFNEENFSELCINLLLRVNSSTREYMVTTYDSFYDSSYEGTLRKIRYLYSQLGEDTGTQEQKENELAKQVNEFNNAVDNIKDIVLPSDHQEEYYDTLLVSKNQLLMMKPQNRSEIISFVIFIWVAIEAMSIENIVDLGVLKNIPQGKKFIEQNKLTILEQYYKENECKDMEEAIAILKAIKSIRNKLVHVKTIDVKKYRKSRKVLGLELKEPVNRLSVINECIQIAKKASEALRTIISYAESNQVQNQ